jgi:branched-subunit amino acid transport protein
MSDAMIWIALVGLGLITVVTRGFFMIGDRPLPMPWPR